jgi:hypothetical protein
MVIPCQAHSVDSVKLPVISRLSPFGPNSGSDFHRAWPVGCFSHKEGRRRTNGEREEMETAHAELSPCAAGRWQSQPFLQSSEVTNWAPRYVRESHRTFLRTRSRKFSAIVARSGHRAMPLS